MRIALKEWAVVIDALARGRQLILLRKGGVAEGRDGFELRHREFLFYPTWEHQQTELIRPEFQAVFEASKPASPDLVPISFLGRAEGIWPAPPNPDTLAAMTDIHIWSDKLVRMRYEYRPDLPLYVVLVRAFRLPRMVEVRYDHRYAGCRSWVDLNEDIDITAAAPVLDEKEFARRFETYLGLNFSSPSNHCSV